MALFNSFLVFLICTGSMGPWQEREKEPSKERALPGGTGRVFRKVSLKEKEKESTSPASFKEKAQLWLTSPEAVEEVEVEGRVDIFKIKFKILKGVVAVKIIFK